MSCTQFKKNTMSKLLLAFGLIFLLNSHSAEPHVLKTTQDNVQITNPDYNIAVAFMNDYITYCNELRREIELIDWISKREDVSEKFKQELEIILTEAKKTSPELGLGFDPIFDAQDFPDKFEIDKTESDYIIVKGSDWPDFTVIMRLKFNGNKWLVTGAGIINIPKDKQRKK